MPFEGVGKSHIAGSKPTLCVQVYQGSGVTYRIRKGLFAGDAIRLLQEFYSAGNPAGGQGISRRTGSRCDFCLVGQSGAILTRLPSDASPHDAFPTRSTQAPPAAEALAWLPSCCQPRMPRPAFVCRCTSGYLPWCRPGSSFSLRVLLHRHVPTCSGVAWREVVYEP